MINFTLKNIPKELHQKLKKQAQAHRRSLNSEILSCLEQAANTVSLSSRDILMQARAIRESIPFRITDNEMEQFKDTGRP